jgi:purine-binding chemotaxis protein CheW
MQVQSNLGDALTDRSEAGVLSQFLTFVCSGEEYGVPILCVQEIKGWEKVTRVPYTPDYLLGVMNLRGVIVPVIDLRRRFGLPAAAPGSASVVIVVRVHTARGEKTAGVVVDAVSEVYSVSAEQIKPTPDLGAPVERACVLGLVGVEDKMIMLLDVDQLVLSCITAAEPGSGVDR